MAKIKDKFIIYFVTAGTAFMILGIGFGLLKYDLNLLRWYVIGLCLLLMTKTYDGKNWKWFWYFVFLIFLFNPFWKIFHFSKSTWQMIDVIVVASFLFYVFNYYRGYAKGVQFEKYVSSLFSKELWTITDRTKDSSKKLERLVESDMNPDFTFRHISTRKLIAVECKYRSYFARGKYGDYGYWWKKEQGERYKKYGEKMNISVFVALGIGGTPQKPNRFFLCPLNVLNTTPYGFVTEKILKPFERKIGEKIIEN
jgi:hypothetical protein